MILVAFPLLQYDWIFSEIDTGDDEVPEMVPSVCDISSYGHSGNLTAGFESDSSQGTVMTNSFNDMHNLIRKANEAEAFAMMDAQRSGKVAFEFNFNLYFHLKFIFSLQLIEFR